MPRKKKPAGTRPAGLPLAQVFARAERQKTAQAKADAIVATWKAQRTALKTAAIARASRKFAPALAALEAFPITHPLPFVQEFLQRHESLKDAARQLHRLVQNDGDNFTPFPWTALPPLP